MRASLSPAAMASACAGASAQAPGAATSSNQTTSSSSAKRAPRAIDALDLMRVRERGAPLARRPEPSHLRGLVLLALVLGDERAPRLRLHGTRRLPHHVELAVGLDLADEHRL